jgi:hypothetical protein
MALGFVGYALGLFAANQFYMKESPYRYWLILLPVIPIIYVVAAIISFIVRGLDELQRKVVTEAGAFSGIATGFTCFSYLFFRDMGAPEFHGEWAFYLMWFYYGVGALLSWRRYR